MELNSQRITQRFSEVGLDLLFRGEFKNARMPNGVVVPVDRHIEAAPAGC
jgi:hypothetical protein